MLAVSGGCLVLRAAPPPTWPPPPPPPGRDGTSLGLYLGLGLLVLLLVGAGLAARRVWRRGGGLAALDREDAALLRTARDALGYLVRRRTRRLRLIRRQPAQVEKL
ncbi:MAG: hypothetical protein K9K66_17590 [Desulfarculaceae bacterium]|nr:hypothetical protein [Desulfarculaceae bacterium]MCF8072571.1 hypothetical protein [Desulfarculaceae bacterium]MCF8103474.1 hypothetical protein [Desulfarculaceae bacterium]MCF8117508.1 hypothetical protein [Desulfarculaceae bacterium]